MRKQIMTRAALALAAITTIGMAEVRADEPRPVEDWTATLYLENDTVGDTDRYYTHGTRLSFISPDFEGTVPENYGVARELDPLFGLLWGDEYTHNISISLGQELFTPSNTDTEAYLPDDRPYAAWTYLAIGIHGKNKHAQHVLELQLGVVGDEALGEETQDLVHRLVGADEAQGWDNQISNEVAFTITYDYRRRLQLVDAGSFDVDAIPRVSLSAGTALTQVASGATLRVGYNIPPDWHSNRIRPAADAPLMDAENGPFSIWLFAGAGGKWVIQDITLDGNTFTSSPTVDKEELVGEVEAGLGLQYSKLRVMLSYVIRTPTFEQQDEDHEFGALSVSYGF